MEDMNLLLTILHGRDNGQERYVYYLGKRNWAESQEICRSKHVDMATVRNDEDNSQIVKLINSRSGPSKVWISLFRDSWTWSDGSETSFRFWLDGRPVLGSDNCAVVAMSQHGHWRDARCDENAMFVCQGGEFLKHQNPYVQIK
ncbi:hypothetical protein LDENG_00081460 [Lucifuga dentata]|nr:hypothetical protein LDENG_00081460 [Lucifuga dentata]